MKDQLVSFVLGELSEQQQSEVTAHTAECDECRAELKQLEQLLRCAERHKDLSADETLLESARNGLLAAVSSEQPRIIARPDFRRALEWRRIMSSPIMKVVAAVIVVTVGLFGASKLRNPSEPPSRFGLLNACVAEEALFTGTEIIHIQNEIIVEPAGAEPSLPYAWLPMNSMKRDGTLRFDQLKMNLAPESYVVTDHSWYDPLTGRFTRVLKTGDAAVFGNSYDGRFIYDANVTPEGVTQVSKQALATGFKPPQSPAEYLGLAAGLTTDLAKDNSMVQKVEEGALADGEPAHIYTVGMPDPNGQLQGYWLFKVRDKDSTIAEKECVLLGRTYLVIRRVLTEQVETPVISWNLAEIEGATTSGPQQVTVTADMIVQNVSVQHMVDRAKFETYVFSVKPSWTAAIEITDCIDPASMGGRMFIMTARAEDGRHLVLVQSPTYNMMMGHVVRAGQVVYTSPNGFKVWGGGPQKWFSQILLQSAQASIKDPPSEDRIGYVLESPAGTFPAIAINGPITDAELHTLVDSLTPAKDYLKAGQATDSDKE